jgi:hypothetical protein
MRKVPPPAASAMACCASWADSWLTATVGVGYAWLPSDEARSGNKRPEQARLLSKNRSATRTIELHFFINLQTPFLITVSLQQNKV